MNPMSTVRINKVTINIGVGKAGEPLDKAFTVLEKVSGQKPIRTKTSKRIPAFDIRPGMAIGVKVTLRAKKALEFLKKALDAIDYEVAEKSFDSTGNFAFGVKEHTDIEGMKYDPDLGVYGMDVCVSLEKPGYRVKNRANKAKVGANQRVTKDEAIAFAKSIGVKLK